MDFDHIIIAIQSDIHREGLCSIIRDQSSDCTIYIAQDSIEVSDSFSHNPNSICLFSATTAHPDIDAFLASLYQTNQEAKSVMMVSARDPKTMEKALRAGVKGLFTQNCRSDEVTKILKEVAIGKNSYSKIVSDVIMTTIHKRSTSQSRVKKHITKRESEILTLIVNGFTSAEIAKKLFISPRTVETHRCNLMGKLKLKNTAELVRFALQEKIV
jgi:DNA-binding NarL/FixJ family response regulator